MPVGKYAQGLKQDFRANQQLNNGTVPGGLAYIADNVFKALEYRKDQKQRQQANDVIAKFLMPSEQFKGGPEQMAALAGMAKDNPYIADFALQLGMMSRQRGEEEAAQQRQWGREDQKWQRQQEAENQRFGQQMAWEREKFGAQQAQQQALAAKGEGGIYGGTGVDAQHFRVLTDLGAKAQQGIPLTASEQIAYRAAQAALSQPKVQVVIGPDGTPREITTPGLSIDSILGGQRDPLAMAVEQQESGGRVDAISPAGARGPMQIMTPTAMDPGYGVPNIFQMARTAGIQVPDESEATAQRLLAIPELNRAFGDAYLNAMRNHYGNDAMALAAYNGGPGTVDQTVARGGDPRTGQISEQQFVGNLPYAETRNYVPGVRNRMGNTPMGYQQPTMPPQPAATVQTTPGGSTITTMPKSGAQQQKEADFAQAKSATYDAIEGRVNTSREILENPGAFVGNAMANIMQHISGTNANQLASQYAPLKSQMRAAVMDAIKSNPNSAAMGGALSDAEGKAFEEQFGRLNPADPVQEQLRTLNDIMTYFQSTIAKYKNYGAQATPASGPVFSPEAQDMANEKRRYWGEPEQPVFSPEAQEMRNQRDQYNQPGGDIPTVNSPAEARKLPKGTRFRTPDGQIRIVR